MKNIVRKRDIQWNEGIKDYINILIDINEEILILIGKSVITDLSDFKSLYLNLAQQLLRLIPYKIDKPTNKPKLCKTDGILNFKKDLKFIVNDYNKILNNNPEIFINLKIIRNKVEHLPHIVKFKQGSSGNLDLPEATFMIDEEEYKFYLKEIILSIKELNITFDKIIMELNLFIKNNNIEVFDSPYYKHYSRIKFLNYNKIFESELLFFYSSILKKHSSI